MGRTAHPGFEALARSIAGEGVSAELAAGARRAGAMARTATPGLNRVKRG